MYRDFSKLTNEEKDNLLEAMYQNLIMIRDIGFDYDGWQKSEDLKHLIDDLVQYAKDGLKGKRPQFENHGILKEYVFGEWKIAP